MALADRLEISRAHEGRRIVKVIGSCKTLKEATAKLRALESQGGFMGGRMYFSARREPTRYVCEAFFEDAPDEAIERIDAIVAGR